MKKKFFCIFISFAFAFVFIFSFSPLNAVSALVINQNYYYGFTLNDAKPWIEALENNSSWPSQISKEHFYCCLTFDNSQSTPILKRLVLFDQNYSRSGSNSSYSYIAPTSYYIQYGNFSISTPAELSNVPLWQYSQSGPGSAVAVIAFDSHYFMTYTDSSGNPLSNPSVFANYSSITFPNFVFSFEPSFVGAYKGLNLDFDPTAFYDWIIDNNKLSSLPSYIVQSKLLSFLQFYKEFGSSYTSFSSYIKDWFSFMNIANQSSDNVQILKNSIDNLYREFISEYIVTFYPNTKNHFHHRQNIDTNTDDSNTTLITDDPSDSTDTSILRDILRGVIAISNNINSNFQALWDKLNNIDFTVSVVNNGGSTPAPTGDTDIDYTDQGDFGIDEIHQFEPLPDAPDIDGDVDFLEYPAVLAQSTNAFFNLLPSDMSALMSAVLVLGVLITKIGR